MRNNKSHEEMIKIYESIIVSKDETIKSQAEIISIQEEIIVMLETKDTKMPKIVDPVQNTKMAILDSMNISIEQEEEKAFIKAKFQVV